MALNDHDRSRCRDSRCRPPDAIGAAGIVLEVATGEVRALASWPAFNPNRPGDASDEHVGVVVHRSSARISVFGFASFYRAIFHKQSWGFRLIFVINFVIEWPGTISTSTFTNASPTMDQSFT